MKANATKVITGENTRFSYANVWEPKVPMGGGKPKYSISLIIPKSDTKTIDAINKAMKAAYDEGLSRLKGNSPYAPDYDALKKPLRDGDKERKGDEAYAGCYFLNANSDSAPGIVDASVNPIIDRSQCYSGVYGRASINFYAFNSNGNKGIAAGLNNLQVLRQGESLGGKSKAEDDFADFDNSESESILD